LHKSPNVSEEHWLITPCGKDDPVKKKEERDGNYEKFRQKGCKIILKKRGLKKGRTFHRKEGGSRNPPILKSVHNSFIFLKSREFEYYFL
jgi:hypothetical protein